MKIVIQENTLSKTASALEKHLEIPSVQRQIAVIALAGVQRNFKYQGRSKTGGTGVWPRHSELTKKWRRQGKGVGSNQILRDKGVLLNGIHPEFKGNKVEISTSNQAAKYAAIQHYGGTTPGSPPIKARQRAFFHYRGVHLKSETIARGIKIPARPYMCLCDSDVREMESTLANIPGV